MNLGDMVDIAIARVSGPSRAHVDVSAPFVVMSINDAMRRVERAALWKFSEAEVTLEIEAGERQATVASMPTDLAVPLLAYNLTTHTELAFHDDRQRVADQTLTGDVLAYSVWGSELKFYPLPNRTNEVLLRYYRTWPALVNDGDEPVFPETFHDMLTSYAAGQLILRLPPTEGKYLPQNAAEPHFAAFHAQLAEMLASDLVMPTFDRVSNHDHLEMLTDGEW